MERRAAMSANPVYTLQLADSATMIPIIGLKDATNRQLNLVYTKPGSLSLDLPIDSPAAFDVALRSTCAIVTRNQRPIWSGACTSIVDNAAAGITNVTFTGWAEELDHRHVRPGEVSSLSFTSTIGGSIISTLLAQVNAQTDSNSTIRPTHVAIGSIGDTQVRTRSYKTGDNYGQLIRELVEIENGCDIWVDPLTRTLNTRAPTAYFDRTKVKFGFNVSPFNLNDVVVTRDGSTLFNRENVAASNGAIYSIDDAASIGSAGIMLEEWLSLSDVGDPTIAAAYAAGELAYKRFGTITYSITPKSYGDCLRPFDDYDLGDKVYFSVDRGRLKIKDQAVRIFAITITIDDNGNEIVGELGVSPS
jgi:hypothetical protein